MATDGESPQGGHELDFGSGEQGRTTPPPATPPAATAGSQAPGDVPPPASGDAPASDAAPASDDALASGDAALASGDAPAASGDAAPGAPSPTAPPAHPEPGSQPAQPEPAAEPATPSTPSGGEAASEQTTEAYPTEAFPPPGAYPAPAVPGAQAPGQPTPGQPYPQTAPGSAGPADGAQPYPGQPGQSYPGQPGQPAQPGQPYPGQPGQPYPGQPGQPYGAQPGPSYPGQPGQPYPGQPGQPYGAQPGQPYPGQPYAAQAGGQPPKKTSKGLIWGLIGGGVAVLIVLILIVALLVVPAITRSSVTAADSVKAYLTAVSKGDAKTALGYLEGVPDKKLLTDEVLKASDKLGGVSHISVAKGSESKYSGSVRATFEVGDRSVSTTYEVYKVKDTWKIANGVTPISLDALRGLDATFNGVSADGITDAYVFPGSYEIELNSKYFSIDGDSTFTIASSDDASELYDVSTKLNDAGVSEFRSLVRSAVESCVALKTLSTPCGMDITGIDLSGATAVEGTVTRTLTADGSAALDTLEPESNGSSPTVVSAYDSIPVDMSLQGSDGQTYTVTFGGYLDTPTVDFGKADPQVTWER